MTHYVLVDNHSGYVWGEADASDVIEACRIVDTEVGGEAREYDEVNRLDSENGYQVYEAPAGWQRVRDGQAESEIERVCALPLVATVTFKTIAD